MYSDEEIHAEYDRTYAMYHKPKAKQKKHPVKRILAAIDRYLVSIGALSLNTPAGLVTVGDRTFSAGQPGRSDRIVCYRGRFIAIEGKAPGKQPTEAQLHYRDRVVAAGGIWIKGDSVDAVRAVMEEL